MLQSLLNTELPNHFYDDVNTFYTLVVLLLIRAFLTQMVITGRDNDLGVWFGRC